MNTNAHFGISDQSLKCGAAYVDKDNNLEHKMSETTETAGFAVSAFNTRTIDQVDRGKKRKSQPTIHAPLIDLRQNKPEVSQCKTPKLIKC